MLQRVPGTRAQGVPKGRQKQQYLSCRGPWHRPAVYAKPHLASCVHLNTWPSCNCSMLSPLTRAHTHPSGWLQLLWRLDPGVAQSAQGQGTKEKCLLWPQKEVGPWSVFFHILVPLPCIPIFSNSFTLTDAKWASRTWQKGGIFILPWHREKGNVLTNVGDEDLLVIHQILKNKEVGPILGEEEYYRAIPSIF